MTTTCPWCSAPRDTGPTCPRCGAIYAKAEAIKAHGRAAPAVDQPSAAAEEIDSALVYAEASPPEWKEVDDAELEWKFCMGANRLPLLYAGIGLILLQATATLGIKQDTALMLITFGGDGAGMILATLLMGSFYFGKRTQLYKGSLRWGFVVIGAAAFVDIYATWWKARKDHSAVPYGTTGGMATDSMTLVDAYGWTLQTLVHRYVVLGVCCLIALALVYAWGVWRARSELEARRLAQKTAEWAARKDERR